ncbi:hypothetical protein [Bacillus sp. NPDC077027]|uniref:deoxynucleotide monophosphate kinase family protein n=1 Tax=Bacillus sp. NPDC077027 TaxID=3390548 RepID=UPI003CFDC51C
MEQTKPLKIGILGEMRAGKDTVKELLTHELNKLSFGTWEFQFSTGIHWIIKTFMPHLYDEGKPREALQYIGEVMRKFDPDVWINYLFQTTLFRFANRTRKTNMIVSDVRQPNEVKRLKEEGFIIIKVIAPYEVRVERARSAGDSFNKDSFNHETEKIVHSCEFDYVIENAGSIDELEKSITALLGKVIK